MQPLVIDGGYGEGGGQIVRTALSLSAITGRPIRLDRIRARRPKPGLAAQHVTAVHALATLCDADLTGNVLGSLSLEFRPRRSVKPGDYEVDIAAARESGSAGAATMVAQAVLLPLALIDGVSHVTIHGGTHVAWSPPFDYVRDVWLPTLTTIGIQVQLELVKWGWFPVGDGELCATIEGHDRGRRPLRGIEIMDRGPLRRIAGRAVASRLPAHIAERMANRAQALLQDLQVSVEIKPLLVDAVCPGAGIFLIAEYESTHCGFTGLGAVGRPAEVVAEEAVVALLGHHRSGEAFDEHLADQVLLPLALAMGPSRFTAERSSAHLVTNASVIEQFGLAEVIVEPSNRGSGIEVNVTPQHARPKAESRTVNTTTRSAPGGASRWNAVVSVYEGEFRAARKILGALGEVWPTDYHNVLVMRVDDPHRLAERFGLWVEREPGVLNTISRLVPAHRTFDFQDVSSFEANAREALSGFMGPLANRSFHIRVHRRGFKHRISSHDEERCLGAFLLQSLARGGTPGTLAFEDPDALVAIETVGQRAGVSVWTRDELRRYPFIRVD